MLIRISTIWILLLVVSLSYGQTSRTKVTFVIKNAGIAVDGAFDKVSVGFKFNPEDLSQSKFEVTIPTTSINTGNKTRDRHLRKSKYFDVEDYPNLTFKSTRIEKTNAGYTLFGDLTIKTTTRSVEVAFTIGEDNAEPFFLGSIELDRRDYGVGRNHLILGDLVKIDIRVPYSVNGNSR